MNPEVHHYTLVAYVHDEDGTLNRMLSVLRRNRVTLDSFSAASAEEPGYARLTASIRGDEAIITRCVRQIEKLVCVVWCTFSGGGKNVARELALVELKQSPSDLFPIFPISEIHHVRVAQETTESITLEIAAHPYHMDELLSKLEGYGIRRVARTGVIALPLENA
ncbi:MAG: acetolactate synthase small subunit [Armatimonadetes bacterium]|nr:acetolactate synthase small subunit [Armatimonadota bacterium]